MIIIKPGEIVLPPPEDWWLGKRATCPKCGVEFELDEADRELTANKMATTEGSVDIVCPTEFCQTLITIQRDDKGSTKDGELAQIL